MNDQNIDESLQLNDKAELLWEYGHYLDSINDLGFKINLYSLGHKFVEVFYKISSNDIEKIVVAYDRDLEKYLSKIVSDVF